MGVGWPAMISGEMSWYHETLRNVCTPAKSNIDTKNDVGFFNMYLYPFKYGGYVGYPCYSSFPWCMTFKTVFCWKWIVSWSQKPIQVHVILNPVCPLLRGFKESAISIQNQWVQKTNPHFLEGTLICDLVVGTYCFVISHIAIKIHTFNRKCTSSKGQLFSCQLC